MQFALVDGLSSKPAPGQKGICRYCGGELIAKCGQYMLWHWAHKSKIDCDPWHESETDWHILWKDCFPSDCQEVVHHNQVTGEKHIADVKTNKGLVVEVQHSPISEVELLSRENFYSNMIWIVDARNYFGYFTMGMSQDLATCKPVSYYFEWISKSTLLKRWSAARKPVYFDIHKQSEFVESDIEIPSSQHFLWRLLEFNINNNLGFIAPLPSDTLVNAAMNNDPLPLLWCKPHEKKFYRREIIKVNS